MNFIVNKAGKRFGSQKFVAERENLVEAFRLARSIALSVKSPAWISVEYGATCLAILTPPKGDTLKVCVINAHTLGLSVPTIEQAIKEARGGRETEGVTNETSGS